MKIKGIKIFLVFGIQLILCAAFSQGYSGLIKKLEHDFLAKPGNYDNYEKLSFLIAGHYLQMTSEQRMGIRKFLSSHARFTNIRINQPGELGIPITIRGKVSDEKGLPLKNVQILIFHTDANGYYAPDDKIKKTMNEPDARLFGYVNTDEEGRYTFQTIHPGTYPNKYEGRYIPQHIHFEIRLPGYRPFSIQMAFEDDPAMRDPYWRNWATKLKYPVTRFTKEGILNSGIYDIVLSR